MSIPIYTSSEMVRLELISYANPEGLHPVEEAWRDLSRKLVDHVKELQDQWIKHKDKHTKYNRSEHCFFCADTPKPFPFPEPFKPNIPS